MNRALLPTLFYVLPALLVGMAAAGCASGGAESARLSARDAEVQRIAALAAEAYRKGKVENAVRLYQQTLERGRAIDSPRDIGDAAFNLAVCHEALGNYAQGVRFAGMARAELERAGQPVAGTWLLEARMAAADGQPEQSIARAETALEALGDRKAPGYRMELHILLANAYAETGDMEKAEEALATAEQFDDRTDHPYLRAGLRAATGRILVFRDDPAGAAAVFDEEVIYRKRTSDYDGMAMALVRAGGAYQAVEAWDEASDRYFRAGRSFFAQGNVAGALKMVEVAVRCAETAGSEKAEQRARALFKEIQGAADLRRTRK